MSDFWHYMEQILRDDYQSTFLYRSSDPHERKVEDVEVSKIKNEVDGIASKINYILEDAADKSGKHKIYVELTRDEIQTINYCLHLIPDWALYRAKLKAYGAQYAKAKILLWQGKSAQLALAALDIKERKTDQPTDLVNLMYTRLWQNQIKRKILPTVDDKEISNNIPEILNVDEHGFPTFRKWPHKIEKTPVSAGPKWRAVQIVTAMFSAGSTASMVKTLRNKCGIKDVPDPQALSRKKLTK